MFAPGSLDTANAFAIGYQLFEHQAGYGVQFAKIYERLGQYQRRRSYR